MKIKKSTTLSFEGMPDARREEALQHHVEYSEEGNIIREVKFENGEPVTEITRTYQDGKLFELIEIDLFEDIKTVKRYSYDGDKLIMVREFYNEEDYVDTIFEFDSNGENINTRMIENGGENAGHISREFPDPDTIKESHFNPWKELEVLITTKLNEQKKPVSKHEVHHRDEEVSVQVVSEFEYDELGNVTEYRIYENNELRRKISSTFDSNSVLVASKVYDATHHKLYELVYLYDENGKLITEEEVVSGEGKYIRSHQYDANGNLVMILTEHIVDEDHTVYSGVHTKLEYWE